MMLAAMKAKPRRRDVIALVWVLAWIAIVAWAALAFHSVPSNKVLCTVGGQILEPGETLRPEDVAARERACAEYPLGSVR
jgi:hypothetical protein